jgi:hypothetical protein
MFHRVSESVREEVGALESKRILFEWDEWARKEAKRQEVR